MPVGAIRVDQHPGIGSHQIIGPSPERIGIQFFGPSSGQCRVSTEVLASIDDGIPLFSGSQPVTLTYHVHGELVRRAWYALNDAGLHPASWIESYK